MPRSGAQARMRLQAAALELVAEHGFDEVTTAAIAARAGVTERTFFRHFPDKREVLFEGERMLADWVTEAFAEVPADAPAWSAMQQVVAAVTPSIVGNRPDADRLVTIIAATPALAERAASKQARLVELIAALLVERGTSSLEAEVVAGSGWGVLAAAIRVWREPGNARSLRSLTDEGLAVLADAPPPSPA